MIENGNLALPGGNSLTHKKLQLELKKRKHGVSLKSPCGRMLKLLHLGSPIYRWSTSPRRRRRSTVLGAPSKGVGRGGRIGEGILQGGLRSHSQVVRSNHSWGLRGSHNQGPRARWAQIQIWQGTVRGHSQQWRPLLQGARCRI